MKFNKNTINYSKIFCFSAYYLIIYFGLAGKPDSGYIIHNFLVIPSIIFMIFSAANIRSSVVYKILSFKPLVILGRASYSFYVLQPIVIMSILPQYQKAAIQLPFLAHSIIALIILFCCLASMSLLSYYLIEEPVRRFINL